jgi:acetyltransferase-like isoleucine patch superfamily enzyme
LLLTKSGIVIGEGTDIGFGSFILGKSRNPPSVTFGKRVAVAPYVLFIASSYPGKSQLTYLPNNERLIQKVAPIIIEDDVWLGARSLIFPGVRIGSSSIVASGAVVRHDVPPKSVVAGVPAKIIRTLD